MLKKIFSVLVVTALILCMNIGVSAAPYTVDEIGASISIPDEFTVYTSDMPEFVSVVENDDVCLFAVLPDSEAVTPRNADEITIAVKEDAQSQEIYNLSRFTKGKVVEIAADMLSEMPAADTYTIFEHEQTKFVKVSAGTILEDASLMFSEAYSTIVNGQRVMITWNSYDSEMTDEELAKVEDLISSLRFEKVISGGMTDYNQLIRNCVITAIVILVVAVVVVLVFKRKNPKPEKPAYTVPAYEPPAAVEPVLSDAEYKPQIAVHILDETFGYSLVNWDDPKEFADYVDDQNTLYLHTFVDKNGKDKTEAMQYSAWMILKREHDESHFNA